MDELLVSLKNKLSAAKDKRMQIIIAIENDSHIGDLPKSMYEYRKIKLDGSIKTLREIIFEIESK